MRWLKLGFYSFVLAAILAGFVYRAEIYELFRPTLEEKIAEFEKAAVDALIKELKEIEVLPSAGDGKVQAPPPLRAPTIEIPATPATELTVQGTINWTNIRRIENGLSQLLVSAKLNAAATLRLEDMFAKQYFAHVSPSGESIEDSAKTIGYEYIAIGENLALGNFSDDGDLVRAWMDSPGHRANILNSKYTEIGVAVGKGIFSAEGGSASGGEGKFTWIAVQIFGKPLSLCPSPSQTLKTQIELLQSELETMQTNLEARRTDIENTEPKRGPEYNRKVDEYNALVEEYNRKVGELKVLIADYNARITEFNECIQQ